MNDSGRGRSGPSQLAGEAPLISDTRTILLYDAECGLCQRSVQFVLRHDRRGIVHFAPLSGALARQRLGPAFAHDSLVLLQGDRVLIRSQAVLAMVEVLGPPWSYFSALGLLPRGLLDALYRVVARLRHELFPADPQCLVPTPKQRRQFLE